MIGKISRVIVVTGANKGIGYSVIEGLVKFDDKPSIVLTSRNEELGKEAVKKLLAEAPDYKDLLHYHQLDITKEESINKFVDWAQKSFGKIDVLVNNAGVATKKELDPNNVPTEEDFKNVFGTNFEGCRALTYKVLPIISDDGKIINVSSGRGEWKSQGEAAYKVLSNPDFEEKHIDELSSSFLEALKQQRLLESGYSKSCYRISKALMNAWTHYVLPKKLKGDQQAFAVCPGWCKTDLGGESAPRTVEQGAETILYLIGLPYKLDPNLNGKNLKDKSVIPF